MTRFCPICRKELIAFCQQHDDYYCSRCKISMSITLFGVVAK